MTENLVYLNGEYVPASEAKISIFDGAISLGMTVTESTRTFSHQPYRLRDHINRLFLSLKAARFDAGMTADEMEQLTLESLGEKSAALRFRHRCLDRSQHHTRTMGAFEWPETGRIKTNGHDCHITARPFLLGRFLSSWLPCGDTVYTNPTGTIA